VLHYLFGLLTVVALAGLAGASWAGSVSSRQQAEVYAIWTDPSEPATTLPSEMTLPSRGDNVVRVTNITTPTIELYRAPDTGSSAPAVLVCPGGGYKILAVNIEGSQIAHWLNSIGVTAAVLKYRVPDQRPAAFHDAQHAMRLLRQNAARWGIDPSRIGIMGFSAGGHLAARISTHPEEASPGAVDDADAFSARPDFAILIYPAYLADKDYHLAEDVAVTSQTPPTFLVQAQDDKHFISSSTTYYRALIQAGVCSELHVFATGGHGYGLGRPGHAVCAWPRLCQAWLKESAILP
jgi:acetyl esterase/lipase